MTQLKIALVMPNHVDIFSSLHNYLKVFSYLVKNKGVVITLFTDARHDVSFDGLPLTIKKIKGFDYQTPLEKALLVLGLPRHYYPDLMKHLAGYDVIIANNPEFYMYAYQAYLAAKKYQVRFLLRTSQTVDGFYLYGLTKYAVNPFAKKAYDYARYAIFSNPEAEQRAVRLGLLQDTSKSIITGHPTDTDCFMPREGPASKTSKPNHHIILSVGGLYELKGHHLIIQALKKIHEVGQANTQLWIVGKGYYQQRLEDLVHQLNLSKAVHFLGAKNHDELVALYQQCDVFVLANYQEITPAVNEALACERPVVAMQCGGCEFVIEDGKTGFISKKFDVDDMAGKIQWVLDNPAAAHAVAVRGRHKILTEFSIKNVAQKMYDACTN